MTIEERLESLEREAKRNHKIVRWLAVLVILCIVGWLVASMFVPQSVGVARDVADEIRTRKLVIVDDMGKERIRASISDENGVGISIHDEQGGTRVAIGITVDEQPALVMGNKEGRALIVLSTNELGPELKMLDAQGKTRIALGIYDEFGSSLNVFDKKGKNRLVIGVTGMEKPVVGMYDERERHCIVMIVDKLGSGLFVYGDEEHPRIGIGITGEKKPILVITDDQEQSRITISVPDQVGPEILINDNKGNVIWSAPPK